MDKNIIYVSIILLVIASASVLIGFFLYAQPPPLEIIGPAGDFELENEDNITVTLQTYSNKVVVIDFIYTNCIDADFCPLSTSKMSKLQDKLIENGYDENDFHLLSISFDWRYDNFQTMRAYGTVYGADFNSWSFLSGNKTQVEDILQKYAIYTGNLTEVNEVNETLLWHNMNFSIIDGNGNIRAELKNDLVDKWDEEEAYNIITSLITK